MLRLGCTPVVNLFEWTAEPILLSHMRPEHKLMPEVGHPGGLRGLLDHERHGRVAGRDRRGVPAVLPLPPRGEPRRPARLLVLHPPARASPVLDANPRGTDVVPSPGRFRVRSDVADRRNARRADDVYEPRPGDAVAAHRGGGAVLPRLRGPRRAGASVPEPDRLAPPPLRPRNRYWHPDLAPEPEPPVADRRRSGPTRSRGCCGSTT